MDLSFHVWMPILTVHSCITHARFSWETKSPKDCEILHCITFQGIKYLPVYRGINPSSTTFLLLSLNLLPYASYSSKETQTYLRFSVDESTRKTKLKHRAQEPRNTGGSMPALQQD